MEFNLQGRFQHVSLSYKILKDILINQIVKGEIWRKFAKNKKKNNKQTKKQAEERDFEKSERWEGGRH